MMEKWGQTPFPKTGSDPIIKAEVPVLGIAAKSGTGKTTMLEAVIPLLRNRGLRLAVIKHSHHDVEMDQQGKDSYRLRHAGAEQLLLATPYRSILIKEASARTEPALSDQLDALDMSCIDLVLVEGFRHEPIPKIELRRAELNHPLHCLSDAHVIALVSDDQPDIPPSVSHLSIDRVEDVADFIHDWWSLNKT